VAKTILPCWWFSCCGRARCISVAETPFELFDFVLSDAEAGATPPRL